MRRRWTHREVREMVETFARDGTANLACRLRRSENSITSKARKLWLRTNVGRSARFRNRAANSRTVDANFFDRDSPLVAWLVGVLWACGKVKSKHRQVLKITVRRDQSELLNRVRAILQCHHQIQTVGDRLIVEIGNSRLVTGLTERFGPIPSRDNPNPPPPSITTEGIGPFALGFLDASGGMSAYSICWKTTPRLADWLAAGIVQELRVNEPARIQERGKRCIVWRQALDMLRIQTWLNNSGSVVQSTDPLVAGGPVRCLPGSDHADCDSSRRSRPND